VTERSIDRRVAGPVTRAERSCVVALTLAFVAVCASWAVLTPVFTVPDEAAHFNSALRLTEGFSWPAPGEARMAPEVLAARDEGGVAADDRSTLGELAEENEASGVDQMTQHPPLYYGLAAGVLSVMDTDDTRADLTLLVLRLAGLVFAVPLPVLAWNATRRITGSPRAGVVGAACLLAVPQLAQVLGGVSNDGLTIALCSVVTWLAVRWMTGDTRRRVLVGLGTALGLALLTKGTALPFVVFVALVLTIWPRELPILRRAVTAIATLALAFVVGGWWWLGNLVRFGDLQPSGLAGTRPTKPWPPGTGPDPVQYLDLFWSRMSVRFWGDFGLLDYPLPEILTDTLSVLAVAVIVGYAYTRHSQRLQTVVLSLLPVVVVVMLLANTWRHFVRTQLTAGMQGRYLFVAIVALIAVSAVAWMRCVPARHHRRAGVVIVLGSAFLAVLGPFRQYIGAYENSLYRVTGDGIGAMLTAAPAGTFGVATAVVTTTVVGAAALVLVIGFVRGPGEQSRVSRRSAERTMT
jgi:hypothetical protein